MPAKSLVKALEEKKTSKLQGVFNKVAIINGDIIKKELSITSKHIEELLIFFTQDYIGYKNSQRCLFYPYRFDKIPIQLISNVYEEFLGRTDKKEKKKKGIFYTRTFVVDFMLSHAIYPKLEKNNSSTILDPACGSGAFLVQAFKFILRKKNHLSIDEKSSLLKSQIFGIDIDSNALQITAFSLYLCLLEGIGENEIKKQIEKRNPILPTLIGSNLLIKNAIVDDIEFNIHMEISGKIEKRIFTKFDCIIANPPWKELKKSEADADVETFRTRNAIAQEDIYANVDKYQISQAFLLKIDKLCHASTDVAIIVNNSIFLNEGACKFRQELLSKFNVSNIFELSDVAKILFKNTEHPCVVLILNKRKLSRNIVKYVKPRLTDLNKILRIISYSSGDIREVLQTDLINEDVLWRIFVNGNWKDYQLVKKIDLGRSNEISSIFCGRGINPNNDSPKEGVPIIKKLIEASELEGFYVKSLNEFNINRNFERERKEKDKLFFGDRILLKRIPSPKDRLRLSAVFTNKERYFKEQIIVLKLNNNELHKAYAALLNSSLIGYYLNITSAQTNKGKKLPSIRHKEITNLPLCNLSDSSIDALVELYDMIEKAKIRGFSICEYELQLDELVFNLFGLLEFEKEMIRDFYQVNIDKKNQIVRYNDIQIYVDKFRENYQLVLKKDLTINASFLFSLNIGTILKFDIVKKKFFKSKVQQGNLSQRKILNLVKEKQIQHEMLNGYINEDKVKLYDDLSFYLIKSNQHKDWTRRRAIEDANEEIHFFISKLK